MIALCRSGKFIDHNSTSTLNVPLFPGQKLRWKMGKVTLELLRFSVFFVNIKVDDLLDIVAIFSDEITVFQFWRISLTIVAPYGQPVDLKNTLVKGLFCGCGE